MPKYTQLGRHAEATITNMVTNKEIVVRGLRIVFKIKKKGKANESSGNVANVDIYNMSPTTRKFIETEDDKNGDPQTFIELRVGYKTTTPKVIFRGRCRVTSTFKSPNWVTNLKGEDGKAQFKYTFEKAYAKGTMIGTIVNDIARTAGIEEFNMVFLIDSLKKARTFSGPPMRIIEELQKTYNFVFDVQDEGAIVRANKYELDTKYLIKLDYRKGLLGEPRTKGSLVVVDALINPEIRPNSFIDLTSSAKSSLDGQYSIQRVDTTGDNFSGPWSMTIEMISVTASTTVETKEV